MTPITVRSKQTLRPKHRRVRPDVSQGSITLSIKQQTGEVCPEERAWAVITMVRLLLHKGILTIRDMVTVLTKHTGCENTPFQ